MNGKIKHKLLLATTNPGKIAELKSLLSDLEHWRLLVPEDLKLKLQVEENGDSYAENARLKAQAYALASKLPALADDSGLEVAALMGAPGLHSARFSPKKGASSADRRQLLIAKLNNFPRPWKAKFLSTVCLVLANGETFYSQGECSGEIIPNERGIMGFGYDSIFLIEKRLQTMAELTMSEKNKLSHRAIAMQEMKNRLISLR